MTLTVVLGQAEEEILERALLAREMADRDLVRPSSTLNRSTTSSRRSAIPQFPSSRAVLAAESLGDSSSVGDRSVVSIR